MILPRSRKLNPPVTAVSSSTLTGSRDTRATSRSESDQEPRLEAASLAGSIFDPPPADGRRARRPVIGKLPALAGGAPIVAPTLCAAVTRSSVEAIRTTQQRRPPLAK